MYSFGVQHIEFIYGILNCYFFPYTYLCVICIVLEYNTLNLYMLF